MRESTKRAFDEVKELPELTAPEPEKLGSVRVIVLASGSKGNSILIVYGKHALMVDAGISPDEACRRSRSVGCALTSSSLKSPPGNAAAVDAILLTHWHRDHCKNVIPMCADFTCPVVCSKGTLLGLETQPPKHRRANNGEMLDALASDSPFCLFPLKVPHEEGSLAFHVRVAGKNIVIAHDLASPTSALLAAVRGADCLLIESNHDPDRIAQCERPDHTAELHAKILSQERGHLSNAQAAEVVSHVDPSRIQVICLTHLSETHNSENEAEEVVRGSIPAGAHPQLYIARQDSAVLMEVNGGPSQLEVSLTDNFRILDRKVDGVIGEQKRANQETAERRIVIGELCAEMRGLFDQKDPGAKLDGFEFFDHWKESKAKELEISKRMLDYWILDTGTVVPLVGREVAKALPIGTISELGKLAKAKGEIPDETLRFAQEHAAHEVKAHVASILYPGRTGHFDGPEDFLSITAGKDKIAFLRQQIDIARAFVSPEAPDHEVIEYALRCFIEHETDERVMAEAQPAPIPPAPDISDFVGQLEEEDAGQQGQENAQGL